MMNKSLIEWCDFYMESPGDRMPAWLSVLLCSKAGKQIFRECDDQQNLRAAEKEWDERGTRWVLEKPFKTRIGKVTPFPVKFEPMFREYCLPMPAQKKKPAVIFVVSMGDLLGEWVPDADRKRFTAAQAAP